MRDSESFKLIIEILIRVIKSESIEGYSNEKKKRLIDEKYDILYEVLIRLSKKENEEIKRDQQHNSECLRVGLINVIGKYCSQHNYPE